MTAAASAELSLEALLVASSEPVGLDVVARYLPGADIESVVASLASFWEPRGMRVERSRAGLALVPAPSVVTRLAELDGKRGRHLSEAAVATLSIIALHQPVSLQDIETFRGVKLSRGILDALMDAGLIRVSSRRTDAGRAAVYVTTEAFLDHYALGALTDLPTPEEIAELVNPPQDETPAQG